jgi:GTP cyclohydrolase IA
VSAVAHPPPKHPTPPDPGQLQAIDRPAGVDRDRAQPAVAERGQQLGHDPAAEQLADTPRRVAAGYAELLDPTPVTATTFPNHQGDDQLVLAKAIPFASLGQHHLLPFTGLAHLGDLPSDHRLGLSKPVVELFAHRLQLQEHLTTQVTDWPQTHLTPNGIGVALEADHRCLTRPDLRAAAAHTPTTTLHGRIHTDPHTPTVPPPDRDQPVKALTGLLLSSDEVMS